MRKTFAIIGIAALLGVGAAACAGNESRAIAHTANNKTVKQDRSITASVTTINVASVADVKFTQGDKASMSVVAPSYIADYVKTEVKGNVLNVWLQEGKRLRNDDDIDVLVTLPKLASVNVAGSGDFEAEGAVKAGTLTVSVAGSGDVDFQRLECDKLTASVAGSGDIDIDLLKAREAVWSVAGSGDAEATMQDVESFTASVVGSGDLKLKCKDCGKGVASVAGSGDLKLSGKVRSFSGSTVGVGDIDTSELHIGK